MDFPMAWMYIHSKGLHIPFVTKLIDSLYAVIIIDVFITNGMFTIQEQVYYKSDQEGYY